MNEVEVRLESLVAKLREQDYRITPQRLALLRFLAASEEHPSAMQIHESLSEQFPTMSLATVYKTLSILKDMGEVLELGFGGDDNRYDGHEPAPHPHLICIRCRKIIDLDAPDFEGLDRDVASYSGFRIVRHRLDFYGICPDCQNGESDKST